MAVLTTSIIEIEEDKTKTGANAGSTFLRVKCLLDNGYERTLRAFKEDLFPAIWTVYRQNKAVDFEVGDSESTQYTIQKISAVHENIDHFTEPQPVIDADSKAKTIPPISSSGASAGSVVQHSSPASRDSRVRAGNIASAYLIKKLEILGPRHAMESEWTDMIPMMQKLAQYFETGVIDATS